MSFAKTLAELQTLDVNNPAAWPDSVRVAAAVLLATGIVALSYWVVIKPLREDLAAREQEEISLRGEFEQKQHKVAALDAYKEQLKEMERSFGTMLRQLPSKTEVANLLADISQTRVENNLEEELFQPQPEIVKDFYAEIPNRIVVTGNYHDMGRFVGAVAALPRIVTIDEVEIRPSASPAPGQPAQPVPRGALRVTALAKTYRYLDDEEMAANKPAKAGGGS